MKHIYQRRVSFSDTDAAGVVHFSRLLCYAEEAEHDLLIQLEIPLMEQGGWPRVSVSCDYLAPLRVGDVVDVFISPVKLGNSSILWGFFMSCLGKQIAKGEMKTVRVNADGKPDPLKDEWKTSLAGTCT